MRLLLNDLPGVQAHLADAPTCRVAEDLLDVNLQINVRVPLAALVDSLKLLPSLRGEWQTTEDRPSMPGREATDPTAGENLTFTDEPCRLPHCAPVDEEPLEYSPWTPFTQLPEEDEKAKDAELSGMRTESHPSSFPFQVGSVPPGPSGTNKQSTLVSNRHESSLKQVPSISALSAPSMPSRMPSQSTLEPGPEHLVAGSGLQTVFQQAMQLHALGKAAEAEPLLRSAIVGLQDGLGTDRPEVLLCAWSLAASLYSQGKATDAEPLLRHAHVGLERTLGDTHLDTIKCCRALAICLYSLNLVDEAEQHFRRALAGLEATSGAEHLDSLRCARAFAACLYSQGKTEEAETYFRRALPGLENSLGADHPESLRCVKGLAACLMDQGKVLEANPLLRRVLPGTRLACGTNQLGTAEQHL